MEGLSFRQRQEFEEVLKSLEKALAKGSSCLLLDQEESSAHLSAQWVQEYAPRGFLGGFEDFTPLVLNGSCLYLRRYFEHEQALLGLVRQRCLANDMNEITGEEQWLGQLFASPESEGQKCAARLALRRSFSVIIGGPGTGKTSTVVKILFLLYLFRSEELSEGVLLLAPTGKAANRLSQSIQKGLDLLKKDYESYQELLDRIPHDASTIHRLLGSKVNKVSFRHDAENPVKASVVIVDETSMVDLALMRRLFSALAPTSRVILLGDQYQLTSVQVGSVLADLVEFFEKQPSAPLGRLTHSFRTSGQIQRCCQKIQSGLAKEAWVVASEQRESDEMEQEGRIIVESVPSNIEAALEHFVLEHWLPVLKDSALSPCEQLQEIDKFRILTPFRQGILGVENLNIMVENILSRNGLVTKDEYFQGRSVIVAKNHYHLGVYNGDTGLVVETQGERRVVFGSLKDELNKVPTWSLSHCASAWALTVHQTQGSEYDHILLVLPESKADLEDSLVSRELLYTGLSRAKKSARIWSSQESFLQAVQRKVNRASGINL